MQPKSNPSSKAVKLLRLALDPAAQPGEISAASLKFIKLLRREGVSAESLLAGAIGTRRTMPFGKFKGLAFDEIDTPYLQWVLKTLTRLAPASVRAIKAELANRRKNT